MKMANLNSATTEKNKVKRRERENSERGERRGARGVDPEN
jgi:hypothetical protein